MKATDFTLAWMQKFDFDGHPYVFSKIDVSANTQITTQMFEKFLNYSEHEKQNVMCILSDGLITTNGTNFTTLELDAGEIVYLSTILNFLSGSYSHYFGFIRTSTNVTMSVDSTLKYRFSPLAGTFYIFDFNENPV